MYRTANDWLGGVDHLLSPQLARYTDEPKFMFPMIGGLLGLLGGLTVFFRGPGGATLALGGGIAIAGFALNLDQTPKLDQFWDNQLSVGVVILMLAAMTASISRTRPPQMGDNDDDKNTHVSGRRVF